MQVTVTHLRPGGGKGQKRGVGQARSAGGFCRSLLHQRQPGGKTVTQCDVCSQGLVEDFEHGMEPQAEVAFVHLVFQLIRLFKTQLAQRKKAVRAAAQVFVGTGGQALHRQLAAVRLGRQCGLRGDGAVVARVCAVCGTTVQLQRLHQGAGQQWLTTIIPLPPQHIGIRQLQYVLPRGPGGVLQNLAWGQAQRTALGGRPGARWLGRGRQAHLVTAGQHHGGKRPGQQLAHGQHHHLHILLRVGTFGHKTRALQRSLDPGAELGGVHAPGAPVGGGQRLDEVGLCFFGQPQGGQQRQTRRVGLQPRPLATGL